MIRNTILLTALLLPVAVCSIAYATSAPVGESYEEYLRQTRQSDESDGPVSKEDRKADSPPSSGLSHFDKPSGLF
jgi:hypothetical protein